MGDEVKQPSADAWGDSISEERTDALRARIATWERETDHGPRRSAFDGERLTGADVFALASGQIVDSIRGPSLHLEGANLTGAHLDDARLAGAHLEHTALNGARLQRAELGTWMIEPVTLPSEELVLQTGGDVFISAHLDNARLIGANLDQAWMLGVTLQGADLRHARLTTAYLYGAHLEGARLHRADLAGADLSHAYLDKMTDLGAVRLSDWATGAITRVRARHHARRVGRSRRARRPVWLVDIQWNGVDLTVVDWSQLHRLGDELGYQRGWSRRFALERATRANIQLAQRLREAGLSFEADRFAYRAQVCQRGVHLLRFRLLRWLFSWLLFIIAGYGYRPLRTMFWYLDVIGAFAFAYFQATHGALTFGLPPSQIQPLAWYEALVLSVSSFHGRGFFQPVQSLGDPVAILAAGEAIIGLLIEITFIATFTQRFFAR